MPGPTGSQCRPLSRLRKRPAPAVPQYTRVGSRASTTTQTGDRPFKCSATVQVEAGRAINRAARVATTMPTMTQPLVRGPVWHDSYVNRWARKLTGRLISWPLRSDRGCGIRLYSHLFEHDV